MVGLAFSIAASCNFPVLLMSIMWRGMTTRGAVIGGFLGLISALVGVIFSPAVWEATMGHPKGSALFQISNPGAVLDGHRLRRHLAVLEARHQRPGAQDRAGFDAQYVRSQTGIGAYRRLGALIKKRGAV